MSVCPSPGRAPVPGSHSAPLRLNGGGSHSRELNYSRRQILGVSIAWCEWCHSFHSGACGHREVSGVSRPPVTIPRHPLCHWCHLLCRGLGTTREGTSVCGPRDTGVQGGGWDAHRDKGGCTWGGAQLHPAVCASPTGAIRTHSCGLGSTESPGAADSSGWFLNPADGTRSSTVVTPQCLLSLLVLMQSTCEIQRQDQGEESGLRAGTNTFLSNCFSGKTGLMILIYVTRIWESD